MIVFLRQTNTSEQLAAIPVPVEGSIAGAAFSSGQVQIVPDVRADPRYYAAVEEVTGFRARSLLAVPLQYREQRVGALEVENKRGERAFSLHDIEILSTLAAQAAVAIIQTNLFTDLQRARDVATALRQAGTALARQPGAAAGGTRSAHADRHLTDPSGRTSTPGTKAAAAGRRGGAPVLGRRRGRNPAAGG